MDRAHRSDLLDLLILLGHRLDSLLFPLFEHPRSARFLDHAQDLGRFHIQDLGDLSYISQ